MTATRDQPGVLSSSVQAARLVRRSTGRWKFHSFWVIIVFMNRKHRVSENATTDALERWYEGADVPMPAIRRYAREIAERFQPQKIVLFGSYAYGKPHAGSDAELLVIIPARNESAQSWKIDRAVDRNLSVINCGRRLGSVAFRSGLR